MPIDVKMLHCWKSHVAAHILKTEELKYSVTRIRRESVDVTKEIKLIKIEKRYCKRSKFIKNKNNILFNSYNNKCRVRDSMRTNNAELKNISVQYSRVLPTEPRRQLIAN